MDIESGLKKSATSGDTALHSQPFHHPALEVFGTKAPQYASLPGKDEGADELDDSMFDVLSNAPLKTGDDLSSIIQNLNANIADQTLEEIEGEQQAILDSIQTKNK